MTRTRHTDSGDEWLRIEVVYALHQTQTVIELRMPPGSTVREAIRQSGILERFPNIELASDRVGIYGEFVSLDSRIHDGDRVEIYRPLIADPKQARRLRAAEERRAGTARTGRDKRQ